MEKRTLVVTGYATATKSPDYIEINMELISKDYDYTNTMNMAKLKYDSLLNSLISIGFRKDDLKTTNFSINAEYKSVIDTKGIYVNEFVGYKAIQSLILGFPFNLVFLNETINAINSSGSVPNITINFTLKNKEVLTNIAIEKAVIDAKEKANVLARASYVDLGYVLSINYENKDIIPYLSSRYLVEYSKATETNIPLDIVPDDVKVSSNVTITWEIV